MSLEQKKPVTGSQVGMRFVPIKVTGTAGTRTISPATSDATITAFASTGTYVITLAKAGRRAPHLVGIQSRTARAIFSTSINADNKTLTITCKDDANSALDADFDMTVIMWDSPDSN